MSPQASLCQLPDPSQRGALPRRRSDRTHAKHFAPTLTADGRSTTSGEARSHTAIVMSWTSVSPGPGTRGFRAGYAAEDGDARQAMQGKASRRLTRTIEARNDATMKVDHLAFLTDPQTRDLSCRIGVAQAA